MKVKTIFLNSVWFGVIPKLSTLVSVLLLPVLTPHLTADDYGVWGLISSYTAIMVAIYSLGMHMHLTNSYYEYKENYRLVWGRLLLLFLISASFFSVVLVFIFFFLINEQNILLKVGLAVLASFPVLFNANTLIANHIYVIKAKPKPLVSRNLIASFIGLFVLFLCVYKFKLGYAGFIASTAVSSVLSFILFIQPLWIKEGLFPRVEKNFTRLLKSMKMAIPVIPHAIGFVLISSSSRLIMHWYNVDLADIGIFSNGYMIGEYITVITTAVVTSLVPKVQELYRAGDYKQLRLFYSFAQLCSWTLVVLFSVWMPEMYLYMIRNSSLQIASEVAQRIAFANVFLPFYFFTSSVVFIEKKSKQLLWLVFVPGMLNLLLCFFLIPIYGYKAVVYSTILSYWSQLLIPFYVPYFRKSVSLWLGDLKWLVGLLVFMIGSFYLTMQASSFSPMPKLLFSIAVGIVFLFGIKYFNRSVRFKEFE